MFVRNHMTASVITVPPTASVEDALYVMREKQIHQLPILDFDGALLGMISERDLLLVSPSPTAALTIHEMLFALSNMKVADIMPAVTWTVGADAPLEEAARVMVDNKQNALAVVEDGKLTGIITEVDIFRVFVEVMSTDQPAIEVTILVPDVPGSIAYLCKAIAVAGGSILNLGTFSGREAGTRIVTAKIGDLSMPHIREISERAVQEKGCQLLDLRPA